jgi:hypothetical protein
MRSIDVYRTTLTKTTEIQTGDQIRGSHYTATCQAVTPRGALFLLDQYLDAAYPMNRKDTSKGGYEESNLREALRSKRILDLFDDWSDRMAPFDNGDLLRIPFFGEIFGQEEEDAEYFEPDGCEQWELMKDRKNRSAYRRARWEWGWLQNKRKNSAMYFALVTDGGHATSAKASIYNGVRPVFLIN